MRNPLALLLVAYLAVAVWLLGQGLADTHQAVPVGLQTALAVLWAFLPVAVAYGLAAWLLAALWIWLARSLHK